MCADVGPPSVATVLDDRWVHCPICDYRWPESTPRCLRCEYDFEHRDARVAIARIRTARARANAMWLAGSAIVFLAPAALFGLGVAFAGLLALAMFAAGVVLVVFGLIEGETASRQLGQARRRTQLPPARVITP